MRWTSVLIGAILALILLIVSVSHASACLPEGAIPNAVSECCSGRVNTVSGRMVCAGGVSSTSSDWRGLSGTSGADSSSESELQRSSAQGGVLNIEDKQRSLEESFMLDEINSMWDYVVGAALIQYELLRIIVDVIGVIGTLWFLVYLIPVGMAKVGKALAGRWL